MERLAICRICLNENYTRLIPDTQLQAVYEKLTSMPFQNAMKPSVVCYTCHGQLYKTHSFMQQCMKAEELLSQMANQLLADDVQELSKKIDSTDFTPSPCSTVQQVSIETLPDVKSGIHIVEEEDVTDVKIEIKNIHIANNPRLATQNGRYIILNDKDNNDISRNKHSQQSDSCKFQCDEENVAKTLIINKNNEGEINKQNVHLIKSNENISDSAIMENSVQNVISDYHCDKESDVDNLQSTISQKNNKNFESCKKDCNIDIYLENKTQLVCDICSREFNSKSELASHVRLCTAIGPYICNVCDKSFTEKGNLKKHTRVHTGERPYVCTVCDKRFTTNGVLKIHQRTHTAEKPYICTVCDKRFTTSGNLMSHARVHTDEKPYACNVCDKRFTTSGNLMSHARVHTDEKPYVCNVCNKTFTARDSLRKHVRVHTAEKPHICTVCDKKFTEKGSLRVHARVHAGEKPYACTLCDKRFTTSGSLRVHARVHTSEKPYICIVCDKRFTTSGNLREHARVHTGEKPYSCNICTKTFRQSTAVKSHLKLHNI